MVKIVYWRPLPLVADDTFDPGQHKPNEIKVYVHQAGALARALLEDGWTVELFLENIKWDKCSPGMVERIMRM